MLLADPCWVPHGDGALVGGSAELSLHGQPANPKQVSFNKNHNQLLLFSVELKSHFTENIQHCNGSYLFLGFTSQPSRHFTKVTDSPGEISVFPGSWAQNVNLRQSKKEKSLLIFVM